MPSTTMRRILFSALVFQLACLNAPVFCDAQIVSRWNATNGNEWPEITNWTAGVPNAPGDVAEIRGTRPTATVISAADPVTLGQLQFLGFGSAEIVGPGSLAFDNPGADFALLRLVPNSVNPVATIAIPVWIAADETLQADVEIVSTVVLEQGIQSTGGNLHKTGAGQLHLNGGSASWDGEIVAEHGTVNANSSHALGSAIGRTTLRGGTVQVNAAIAEPFLLESGRIIAMQSYVPQNGPLMVTKGNTALVQGPFELRGGSTGAGDLRLVATSLAATTVSQQPLSHDGGVFLSSGEPNSQFATFRVDNNYTGMTSITDVSLDVRTAHGLGTADQGTTVTRGTLRLHAGSQESVSLTESTLALWSAEETLPELSPGGRFQLTNSTLTNYGQFRGAANYIIAQPMHVDGEQNTISTQRGSITLAEGISGRGNLLLNPNGNNSINLGGRLDLDGALEIRGGPVRFTAENLYGDEIMLRNGGRVVIEADQHIDRIRSGRLVSTGCCSPSGTIDVQPGATLHAKHIDISDGMVRGTVIVEGGLSFSGFVASKTISHLDSEMEVTLKSGRLVIDDSLAGRNPTNGSIHVARQREAALFILGDSAVDADLFLNNGSGFNYWGALQTGNDGYAVPAITLRGDIHLGDVGAHIGGQNHIRLEGQIYGGDLKLGRRLSSPGLSIVQNAAAYTGATQIYSGELVVAEAGRLAVTNEINVYAGGSLVVDNLPSDGAVSDRIGDNVPINLVGGELSVWPTQWGMNSHERVGTVTLKRGVSTIRGTHYFENSRESHADLSIAELVREPGATVSIVTTNRRTSSEFPRARSFPSISDFILETPEPLANGILPAWISDNVNFTTYGPGGRVVPFQGPFASFATSDSTSIVRPPSSASQVTEDKTIHALYAFGNVGAVDLGGHTLTIGNGGVSGAVLSNGTIRPGEFANGEMIFFGGVTINADIVDNGSSTSVVYAGKADVGGNNSYTGTTYVTGRPGDDVTITRATGLPTGGDIEISGYVDLRLDAPGGNTAYRFGDIAIRDGGTFTAQCCGNGDTVRANRILLEDGVLALPLDGDVPIVKATDGFGIMRRNNPLYSGSINVDEGILYAQQDGFTAFGAGKVNVGPAGRLILPPIADGKSDPALSPQITLAGGSLFGVGIATTQQVNYKGTLEITGHSTIYLIDGVNEAVANAYINIDGSVHVAEGSSLTVIGRPDTSRGLQASGGIKLEHSATLAGVGVLGARVDVADGGILSPGLVGEGATVGMFVTSTPILVDDLGKHPMTWGKGGRYRWEINDLAGEAGAQFERGWDLLRVGDVLDIQATAADPFIIEPVFLTTAGDAGHLNDLRHHQQFRWLIAEIGTINAFSATISGFDPQKFAVDVSSIKPLYPNIRPEDFWLDMDATGIHLNLMYVPEPGSLLLSAITLVVCCSLRKRWPN